MAEVGAL